MNENNFIDYEELCYSTMSSDANISFNKKIASLVGIEAAVYLSALLWKRKWFTQHNKIKKEDKQFFNTQEDMEKATTLPPHKQTKAIATLKEYNIINVKKQGNPAKNYFEIKFDFLHLFISLKQEILNDKSLSIVFTSQEALFSQVIKHVNDYINNLNKNTLNKIIQKNPFSKEKGVSYETPLSEKPFIKNYYMIGTLKRRLLNNKSIIDEQVKIPLLRNREKNPLSKEIVNPSHREVYDNMKFNNQPKQKKKKNRNLKTPLPISDEVKKIWSIWESNEFKLPSTDKLLYNDTVIQCNELIKGRISEIKIYPGIEKIEESISRFKLTAFEVEYWPDTIEAKKLRQHMSLKDFIYNSFKKDTSLLKYYIDNKPRLLKKHEPQVIELWPTGTAKAKNFYREHCLGSLKREFTISEMDKFRKAGNFIEDFYKKWYTRIRCIHSSDFGKPRLMDYLCEAVWDACGNDPNKFHPGSFSTPNAEDRLIARLNSEGLIIEENSYWNTNNANNPKYRAMTSEEKKEMGY